MSNADYKAVHSLLGHKEVDCALVCLSSLKRFSRTQIHFILHDDGTLDLEDKVRLTALLNPIKIISRKESNEIISERLKRFDNCLRFRSNNVLGLKLFDIPLLAEDDFAYCDSDVLFIRPFDAPLFWNLTTYPIVCIKDNQQAYSVRPGHLLGHKRLRLASMVNTGFLSMRYSVLDLEYVEWILSRDTISKIFLHIPQWAEQTIYAALAGRFGCGWLDPNKIIVANENVLTRIEGLVGIHFVSTYRSYLNKATDLPFWCESKSISCVSVFKAADCGALDLTRSIIARKFNEKIQRKLMR